MKLALMRDFPFSLKEQNTANVFFQNQSDSFFFHHGRAFSSLNTIMRLLLRTRFRIWRWIQFTFLSRSWYKTVLTAQLLLLSYVYHKHTVSLPLRHLLVHIGAMDTAAVSTYSYEETQLNVEKRVHWALNLEEIFFFYPDAKSKAPKSMLKKFQIKFRALKDNHRSNILEVFYRDHLFKIRSQIERIIEPLTGKIDAESKASHDLVNSDSYWDELFELYGNCKPALKE